MADTFGAMQLPVPIAPAGVSVSDPFLQYAPAFFQAVVNAKGGNAWALRVSTDALPIKTVHDYDPAELSFVERELPCLYMWRGEGAETEWLAEDILVSKCSVHALWIMPPCPEETQKKRVQFVNATQKLLAFAFEIGRDPSWIVPNDPDPQAATYGSVFPRWAGWISLSMSKWAQKIFILENPDAKERYAFHAFEATLTLEEDLVEDIDKFSASSVDVTEKTADLQVETDHSTFT